MPKFNIGEHLKLVNNSELAKAGWDSNLVIEITAIKDDVYSLRHVVNKDQYWIDLGLDRWNADIIDSNFEVDKVRTVLYGRK